MARPKIIFHKEVYAKVSDKDLVYWSTCDWEFPSPNQGTVKRSELAYITRELSLGNYPEATIKRLTRNTLSRELVLIALDIRKRLTKLNVIVMPNHKLALNQAIIELLLNGNFIPEVCEHVDDSAAVEPKIAYYAIYLRQIKNLNEWQIKQRVFSARPMLEKLGLWDNPNAEDGSLTHVDPEKYAKRWHKHTLALKGISADQIIAWSRIKQPQPPKTPTSQLLSKDELSYITRRMALGDRPHTALTSINRPFGPALRRVAYKIMRILFDNNIVTEANQKLPALNVKRLRGILRGTFIPPKVVTKDGVMGKTVNRHQVYYMIYLRQVKHLSCIQLQRLTNCPRVKSVLQAFGLWDNEKAKLSHSYATGKKKHRRALKIKWEHPDRLVETQILDYAEYKRRVRHFTNVNVAKYGSKIVGGKKLNEYGYEVDHILSIKDGFANNGKQVPWQFICHPANLQVLTASDNNAKGGRSDHSPKDLARTMRQFNHSYGTVLIPIDEATMISLRKKYHAMGKLRKPCDCSNQTT